MKILNTIHAQSVGGVDQVFRDYNEVLIKNGHEVAILISAVQNQNDLNKYQLPGLKKIFQLKNLNQIFDCIHLAWIIFKFKPNVVICHSSRLMKWMKILQSFFKVKSIAVNHGISFKNSLYCDYLININQQIHDAVVATGYDAGKSFVLYNAIKITEPYIQKTIKTPPIIGIYGRIEPRKGFDILFQAAEILRKNNIDFFLKIGGFEVPGGYHWQYLKDLAKSHEIFDQCRFYGMVTDKKDFFSDVDIFCVPSREEPFGLVILEGFLYSTLVISSNTDGGKLLIDNDQNGLLFTNENSQELANQIIKALTNAQSHHRLTSQAFLNLEKKFSFDSLSVNLEKLLTQVAHNE